MKKWFANPRVRLAVRAVAVGAIVAYLKIKGHHVDRGLAEAAATAGVWAALEAFTPLNGLVGFLKQQGITPPKP